MGEHSGAWEMGDGGGGTQRYGVPLQVGRSRIRAGIGDGSRGRGQLPGENGMVCGGGLGGGKRELPAAMQCVCQFQFQ